MVDGTFYKDPGKRILNPDLFYKTAQHLAEDFAKADEKFNKRSQLRKFYDEVLRLNEIAKSNDDEWINIFPYVNMLIAKATYAQGRKLVTDDFVDFIKKSIDQIHSAKDLDVFANLFEAFMGFYRKYRQSN